MNEENGKENSLIIYTIFFSLYSQNINFLNIFSNIKTSKNHLNEIAILGGTNQVFEENSFSGLDKAFQKIASAINRKYGRKLK